MPACIIATSACRLCIDYIQQQCVCFRPIYFGNVPFRSRRDVSLCSVFRGLYTCSVYFSVQLVEPTGVTQEGVTQQYTKKWGSRGGSKKRGEVKNGVKWGASVLALPSVFRTLIWYSDFLERGRGRANMQGQYAKAQKCAIKTSVNCTLSSPHRKQKSCPRTKYAYLLIYCLLYTSPSPRD